MAFALNRERAVLWRDTQVRVIALGTFGVRSNLMTNAKRIKALSERLFGIPLGVNRGSSFIPSRRYARLPLNCFARFRDSQ